MSEQSRTSRDRRESWLLGFVTGLTLAALVGLAVALVSEVDETDESAGVVPTSRAVPTASESKDPEVLNDETSRDSDERIESASPARAPDRALRWPPPDGWESFEALEIGPEGGRFDLEPGVDYRIEAPLELTRSVDIRGGRDVVWIGGAVSIDRPDDLTEPIERGTGLTVRDDDSAVADGEGLRIVHLEGISFGGSGLTEGINIDAPAAIVQIQNVHVDDITFASADDRDGTGPYETVGRNHPDLIQTYGGHVELRIDGFSGRSGYQGLFFKIDHDDGRGGQVRLRHVDVRATDFTGVDGFDYAGNRMYFWDAATIGDQFLETGTVWVEHHPDAGKVADAPNPRSGAGAWWHGAYRDGDRLVAEAPPGSAGPADAVERLSAGEQVVQPRVGHDDFGRYLWWPVPGSDEVPAVLDSDGDEPGRIHIGRPPGGPYVARERVGTDYAPPGYERNSEEPKR